MGILLSIEEKLKQISSILILKVFLTSLVLMLPASIFGQSGRSSRLPVINAIKEARLTNGCGYYLARTESSKRQTLLIDTEAKTGWMNLDGSDTPLKITRVSRWRDTKTGARRNFVLTAGGVRIDVLTIVLRVTDENEMDGGLLKAYVTIKFGRRQRIIKLIGWNGC